MNPEVIRTFIAIELPGEIRSSIDTVMQRLKNQVGIPVRWVPIRNIHLTIKFLGDVTSPVLDEMIHSLDSISIRHPAFIFQVGELGVFPNQRRPRVIWIGINAPEELFQLSKKVEMVCSKLGFPPEGRPFSPHLTIGRVHQSVSEDRIKLISHMVSNARFATLGEVHVDGLSLIRSDLLPTGAFYSVLRRFPLAKG